MQPITPKTLKKANPSISDAKIKAVIRSEKVKSEFKKAGHSQFSTPANKFSKRYRNSRKKKGKALKLSNYSNKNVDDALSDIISNNVPISTAARKHKVPATCLSRWLQKGYRKAADIAPAGPKPKLSVFTDALVAGHVEHQALIENALDTQETQILYSRTYQALGADRNEKTKNKNDVSHKVVESMQKRYGFLKRKPQLTTTSRKRAGVGDSCVDMLRTIGELLVKYKYMTKKYKWTKQGKKHVICLDETGGKDNTKRARLLHRMVYQLERRKLRLLHTAQWLQRILLFETVRPLIITSRRFA